MNTNLTQDLHLALKDKDVLKVSVLRLLLTVVHNAEITKRDKLSENEFQKAVRQEIKRREEAIEAYLKVNRPDRAATEEEEVKILAHYLPPQLADVAVEKVIDRVLAGLAGNQKQNFGLVMSQVMARLEGRATGKQVSFLVKQKMGLSR